MKEKFELAFDDILSANRKGEIRNLLITDNNDEFLDEAVCTLRSWAASNSINLVELDEKDSSWVSEIQSRKLFCKLNQPNTVLLIRNYTTGSSMLADNNTPKIFLRNAVMNRCYTYGDKSEQFDELTNLMFVVVINDLSEMKWSKDEYMTFSVIHQDDTKKVWTNKNVTLVSSKMHPVMSAVNQVKFWVSDDETTLCVDVGEAFRGRRRVPLRYFTANDKAEMIHTYIESNLPEFNDRVDCLILKTSKFCEDVRFVIDAARLKKSFPKLGTICCTNNFQFVNIDDDVCTLDPFDLGEMSFYLALDDDIAMANSFTRELWALDRKWAEFFREVAKDYYRGPEEHAKVISDGAVHNCTGMDHLFHIYLFGWYHSGNDFSDEEGKVYVTRHKNFDKALELIPVRFKNCSIDEAASKLYWDIRCLREEFKPDFIRFEQVLVEAEKICPGVLAIMKDKGWITED